jgi:uncharacterized membrane protein
MDEIPSVSAYAKFRRSKAFLILLCSFIALWVSMNLLHHFDVGWGALNLILSIEATISMALMMRDSAKQEHFMQKLLKYISDNTAATLDAVVAIRDTKEISNES